MTSQGSPEGNDVSPEARRWLDLVAVEEPVLELRQDCAVFILDGLAELGPGGLAAAGQDLAARLAALNPGARLAWRQAGTGKEAGPGDGSGR